MSQSLYKKPIKQLQKNKEVENFRVIGIDPGTRITGFGLLHAINNQLQAIDFGCITPPKKAPITNCHVIIYESVCELIRLHKPHAMSIETQFIGKNPSSAIKLSMVRGVVALAASQSGIPVFEYSPKEAKKAVTGIGAASKSQVQNMVRSLLRLSVIPEPEDAADALALAICHYNSIHLNWQYGKQL